jgi:hypothetical protein
MALVNKNRVRETSTTTGTGAYTLAGAAANFQSFAAIGDANTTWYVAEDGSNWEVGVGTYTASGTTLARTTILASSNANAAVNWGAGTKNISNTLPAEFAISSPAVVASRIYRATDQNIPAGNAWTDLSFSNAAYQINNAGWSSGSTYTIPETGLAFLAFEADVSGAALLTAATVEMQILVNGLVTNGADRKVLAPGGTANMWSFAQRSYNAGDTVKIQFRNSDATNVVTVVAQTDGSGGGFHSPDLIYTKITGAKGDQGVPGETSLGLALSQHLILN